VQGLVYYGRYPLDAITRATKMNNTLVTTICIAAALVVATILFKECGKPAVRTVTNERIKYVHDTVYKYDKTKFRDTFTRINRIYLVRRDSIRLWLAKDSSWDNVCKIIGADSANGNCRYLVLERAEAAKRGEALIPVYQAQRTEDSSQIAAMFELDSLTTEAHLSEVKGLKGEIVQAKRKSGKKAVKFALGGALVGFILGKI
jgi:hypothetical protein